MASSCTKEFTNPYDPATPADVWMPRDIRLDTLGPNKVHLFWQQDIRHIDGYVVQKFTNGQSKEYLVFRDTIDFIDSNVVETNIEATCPEIRYEVLARAGSNRSLAAGMQTPIYMPLSTPAYAGEDIMVTDTSTSVQLNAQPTLPGESGQWTIVSGTGGAFENDRQHNTRFTGTPCNAYILRWTKQGCTETYDELNVAFFQATTTANAGSDQSFNDATTQTTLNANQPATGQTGIWTVVSGTGGVFADASSPTTQFTGQSCTAYVLKWSLSGNCFSSDDNVNISFFKAPTAANAGSNQTITTAATSVSLAANTPASGETGTWSIISGTGGGFSNTNAPNATFTGNSCTTYILRWTIQGQCSNSSDDVTIGFAQSTTTANAGVNQTNTTSATSVTLSANTPASGETGTWSILSGSGGIFINPNAANATFTGNACTSYTLRWTIQGPCSSSSDQVTIAFQQAPNTANAGSDQTASSLTVNLAANAPASGVSGTWSIVSGTGGSFSNINSPSSSFTGIFGQTFVLKWTLTACNTTSFDQVSITFPMAIPGNGVVDIDGNSYSTTIIGTQEWMGQNLRTSKYANGNSITYFSTWPYSSSTSAGYSYYNNSSSNNSVYGKLYNWYAATDSRNVCPTGWHVPSKIEWDILFNYLASAPGGKLKETGTSHWLTPNTGATNEVNFTALPGGYIDYSSSYNLGEYGYYLSTTIDINNSDYAELERLVYINSGVQNIQYYKNNGYSIRCLKN